MSILNGHKHGDVQRSCLIVMALLLTVSLSSCSNSTPKAAEKQKETGSATGQRTFASPTEAGVALLEAAKTGNQKALMEIFGPEGKDLIYSGDAVQDKNTLARFVDAYGQMNRWSKSKSGAQILYVGADNFAFPIPLEQNASGQWVFDTASGSDEVLARRIGDGELTAMGVLTEIAAAQQEYFSQKQQFAQKFVSDEGQHNGLYWPAAEGERQSPLGPLGDIAQALGYSRSDKPQPFHGYYYRMLTQQGEAAKGGAKDYVVDGKLSRGFGVLAWPAKYQDSGIMTFTVGPDGVVYEKDLGEKTADAAAAISAYNPVEGWTVVLAPESPSAPAARRTAKK
jgi:hypothetical protein